MLDIVYNLDLFENNIHHFNNKKKIVSSTNSSRSIIFLRTKTNHKKLKDGYYLQYDCTGEELSTHSTILPNTFSFNKIYPNPFNPSTTIDFLIPFNMEIEVSVHDITGRIVSILESGVFDLGRHSIFWDASNFSSGIYFIHITNSTYSMSQKIVLIK